MALSSAQLIYSSRYSLYNYDCKMKDKVVLSIYDFLRPSKIYENVMFKYKNRAMTKKRKTKVKI